MKTRLHLFCILFAYLVPSHVCVADDTLGQQALALAADVGDGVITVESVVEFMVEGATPQEREFSIPGTVIDASGLTIVSRGSITAAEALLKRRIRRDVEMKLTDFVMVLGNGVEIDAKLVLVDEKLNIAFVAPIDELDEEDAALITPIHLPQDKQPVALLDQTIVIGRTAQSLDRSLVVRLVRVNSIVEKPRKLYVGDFGNEGLPVFTPGGALIGITGAIQTSYAERLTPVIPTHYLAKVAAQAMDAPEVDGVENAVEESADAAEDATAEDETAEDETAEDETAGDETAGDETAGDETAEDETAGDETAGEETPEDVSEDAADEKP